LLTSVVSKVLISNLETVYDRENVLRNMQKCLSNHPLLFTKQYIATTENVVVNDFFFFLLFQGNKKRRK